MSTERENVKGVKDAPPVPCALSHNCLDVKISTTASFTMSSLNMDCDVSSAYCLSSSGRLVIIRVTLQSMTFAVIVWFSKAVIGSFRKIPFFPCLLWGLIYKWLLSHAGFSALCVGCLRFLCAVIGSFECMNSLWLAKENCSITVYRVWIKFCNQVYKWLDLEVCIA